MAQTVQSVERALSLLEVVASSATPPSVAELATAAGVNRATTWRLLNTLVAFGLVTKDPDSGRYVVGATVVRLAGAAGYDSLVRLATPILAEVVARTGGSAFLQAAVRGRLVVLDEHRAPGPLQVDLAGVEVPLHCGSLGKLHLSTWTSGELEDYLASDLSAPTEWTHTDPTELRREVERARESGVAFNYREHSPDWCATTAAVRDRAGRDVAYINITLPTWTTSEEQLIEHAVTVKSAADRLAASLTPVPLGGVRSAARVN